MKCCINFRLKDSKFNVNFKRDKADAETSVLILIPASKSQIQEEPDSSLFYFRKESFASTIAQIDKTTINSSTSLESSTSSPSLSFGFCRPNLATSLFLALPFSSWTTYI